MARQLLLLSALFVAVTASGLRIYQGRVRFRPSSSDIYLVDRIATVEIGASNPPSYYFDCNTTANDGTGITWRKRNGRHRFTTEAPIVGNGLRLDAGDIGYSDLDVYICEDSANGDVATLNITDENPAILVDENMLGAVRGQRAEFRIYASSYPLLSSDHIRWYAPDGTEIQENEKYNFQESRKVLVLSNAQPEDVGTYECDISIPISITSLRASTMFDLDVYVIPSIEQHPQNLSNVLEWTDQTITCAAQGNPIPTITWEREGGANLPSNTLLNTRIENDTLMVSELTFRDIRQASTGRYRCVASTIHTASNSSYYADIIVTPAIQLDIRINGQLSTSDSLLIIVQNGDSLSIECYGSGSLQWTASNGLTISSSSTDQLYQSVDLTRDVLTLVVQSFSESYETTYTCRSTLGVESSVFVTNSNPAVFISSKLKYVLPGNSFTLSATVYSDPQNEAVSEWHLNGQRINVDGDSRYSTSINGNQHELHLRNVDVSLLGLYKIVVTVRGQNSSDSVNLTFPDPPTATVTPSDLAVVEGESAHFRCEKSGSGSITATWSMDDGRVLPDGVFVNGTDLIISSVLSNHKGMYVCSVSSFAGTQNDSAVLTVFYRPTAVIRFGEFTSTSSQLLSLTLGNGVQGPMFSCEADGNPPPTFEWVRSGGESLPNRVTQGAGSEGHELRWQRPLEYTDSGMYQCRASNSNGTSVVTLDLLVEATPIINTIYPTVPVTSSDLPGLDFLVPSGYVGVALTCNAFGWPPPLVEWTMTTGPLPEGVVSVASSSANSAIITSELRWTRGFQTSDVGVYQCVVRRSNATDSGIVASQLVAIRESTGPNTPPPVSPCKVNDDESTEIYFQIRVLNTECVSWDSSLKQHIASEFRDEVLNIVEMKCSCGTIEPDYIQIFEPECSQVQERAAVFRGRIMTSSASLSKSIFCSLSEWQRSGAFVTINNQNLRSVDSQCSLQLQTLTSSECVIAQPEPMNQNLLIIIVVVAVAVFLMIFLLIVLICCVSCCCLRRKQKDLDHSKHGIGEDMYSRTHTDPAILTRYRGHSVGPTSDSPTTDPPVYSTLENIPPRTTPLPPPPPFQPSPDHDISYPLLDPSQDMPDGESAEAYQIRLSADSVKFSKPSYYPDSSDPSSNTSRLTSPTQKSHPASQSISSNSTSVIGAVNPMSDYEQIDGFSHVPNPDTTSDIRVVSPHSSVTVDMPAATQTRKYSEGAVSAISGRGLPPIIPTSMMYAVREEEEKLKQSFSTSNSRPEVSRTNSNEAGFNRSKSMSNTNSNSNNGGSMNHSQSTSKVLLQQQRSHPLETGHRDSQSSEGPPPPYSSRPTSALTASASSMVGNGAYESNELTGNENGHQPWYHTESDFSLDSNSRRDLNNQERIPPYAMIHNSAIPVTQTRPLGTSLPSNIQTMPPSQLPVGSSAVKRPVLFAIERTRSRESPQPYSEPIQSSMDTLASYGRAQESPNFEMVTV